MKKKTIKLSDEKALELYKTADLTLKQILEENWGHEFFNQDITDRIKTMKDVLDYLNIDRLEDVLPYPKPKDKFEVSINGFIKVKLITKVLNEDWQENFSDINEYKYYPWFKKKALVGFSAIGTVAFLVRTSVLAVTLNQVN